MKEYKTLKGAKNKAKKLVNTSNQPVFVYQEYNGKFVTDFNYPKDGTMFYSFAPLTYKN